MFCCSLFEGEGRREVVEVRDGDGLEWEEGVGWGNKWGSNENCFVRFVSSSLPLCCCIVCNSVLLLPQQFTR